MKNLFPPEILYVSIAAVGGVARYLNLYLMEGQFAWKHFIAHILVSAFSGFMFYQFAVEILGLPNGAMALVSGMGGWMGVEALKMVEIMMKRKLKTK